MSALILSAAIIRAQGENFQLLGRQLQAGTPEHGYFGEYSAAEVISYNALAVLTGVTAGILVNSNGSWLGFALNGKKLLVAKTPIRQSISWSHLNTAGVVHGKQVVVLGQTMLCRLLSGANADPCQAVTGNDQATTHGSEWNRLLYHVSSTIALPAGQSVSSEGITTGDWAQFSDTELGIQGAMTARFNWCKEVWGSGVNRLVRGSGGITNMNRDTTSTTSAIYGWRPVLELVD